MSLHRLYFDESGVHSFVRLESPHERYLALCGVVFEDAAYRAFQEGWEKMKRAFFKGDPDEPIILHRKEIMGGAGFLACSKMTLDARSLMRRSWKSSVRRHSSA